MRIDAAATQPVFGRLCHQLIGIAGRVRKRPILERAGRLRHKLLTPSLGRPGVPAWSLSQETVGLRFFGHVEISTINDRQLDLATETAVDVTLTARLRTRQPHCISSGLEYHAECWV